MKRLISIVVILCGMCLIHCFIPGEYHTVEGFWDDSYPVHDSSGGFLFNSNGDFMYFHLHNYNIERRYLGAWGKWRIEKNMIEILIEKHFYLRDPVVLQNAPSGKYSIGENNIVMYLDTNDTVWKIIGDSTNISTAHFPNEYAMEGKADQELEFPCVMLPQINNGYVSESRMYYKTQLLNNLSFVVTSTAELFQNAKKGNRNQWSPGNPVQVQIPGHKE